MNEPLPSNPELELAVAEERENPDVWNVYADWLQSQGHPLGVQIELEIALLRGGDQAKLRREMQRHVKEFSYKPEGEFLLGPDDLGRIKTIRLNNADQSELELTWERGMLRALSFHLHQNESAEIHEALLGQLRNLYLSPFARFLYSLSIKFVEPYTVYYNSWSSPRPTRPLPPALLDFCTRPPSNTDAGQYLEHLILNTPLEPANQAFVDLTPLTNRLPRLQVLDVKGPFKTTKLAGDNFSSLSLHLPVWSRDWRATLASMELPDLKKLRISLEHHEEEFNEDLAFLNNNRRLRTLKTLELSLKNVNRRGLKVFEKFNFPRLKYLSLNLDPPDVPDSLWQAFRPFFLKANMPVLKSLFLNVTGREADCLQQLTNAPFLGKLQVLDFPGKFSGNRSLRALLSHRETFRGIGSISFHNVEITRSMRIKLEEAYESSDLYLG